MAKHLFKATYGILTFFGLLCSAAITFANETIHETAYVIEQEIITIQGRTKEKALLSEMGFAENEHFPSKEALEAYVAQRRQKLDNLRAFKECGIEISYPENADALAAAGETVPVTLHMSVTDGWPILPVPYASYNSNEGFFAGVFINAPNMAGSLQNFNFIGMYIAPHNETTYELEWANPNISGVIEYTNVWISPLEFNFSAAFARQAQSVEFRGTPYLKSMLYTAALSANARYDITDKLANTVTLSGRKSFDIKPLYIIDPEYLKYGPLDGSFSVQNTFAYSDYNWQENLRQGFTAGATAGYTLNIPKYAPLQHEFSLTAWFSAYKILGTHFNPGFRVLSFVNSGLPQLNVAKYVRGVRDSDLAGNTGFFLNLDFQIKLFKLFKIEVQLCPTFDYGYVYAFNAPGFKGEHVYAAGVQLFFIAESMKSMPVRVSFAYDLRPKYGDNINKRLEIEVSMSFTY